MIRINIPAAVGLVSQFVAASPEVTLNITVPAIKN